jgi:tight adherence protein C
LTQTLKIYAGSLRFKRHQDTKELIQRLPVKLAFPLVFCILPALFVVILGPSLLRMFSIMTGR